MRCLSLLLLLSPVAAFIPTASFGRTVTRARSSALSMVHGGEADLIETAKKQGNLNTVLKAIEVAGLTETLKSGGIFTCYLPNDDAFAKLPAGTVDALLADVPKLKEILTYHVVKLFVKDEKVIREFRLSNKLTVNGGRVRVVVKPAEGDAEQVVEFNRGEAYAVKTDIECTNGHIHIIDGVLTPQEGTVIPKK